MLSRLLSILCLLPTLATAQNCDYTLSGYTLDQSTDIALPFTNIYIDELEVGEVSDANGYFEIKGLCAGDYHIDVSHVGCEAEHQYVQLRGDTTIEIHLHHHSELLDEVVVHGHSEDNTSQVSSAVNASTIQESANENLAEILETISGVSVLKSGSGISKPVIHGLYGNRVAILNNGVAQSGQQWGNDHAPEIDPFVADHLSVVKGAAALQYGSNSLGGVVLVEAGEIDEDPNLRGHVNYIFETNGRGHTLNTQFEKQSAWAAWRITGTLKGAGDTHAPNYFLTNTGKREGNLAIQVDKKYSERWHNSFYFSVFNAEIGVLRGSHIGNLTDLTDALEREVPFFTNDTFSYQINPPRQFVRHYLAKYETKYFLPSDQVLSFKYGGQLNNRKEFDNRRNGKSDIPALALNQFNHFVETTYQRKYANDWNLKTGVQFTLTDNANEPGTGISPLIPRYEQYNPAGFVVLKREQNQWMYEMGGRYDYKKLKVQRYTNTVPSVFETPEHDFHNLAASLGAKYKFSPSLKASANLGLMQRAPEVNELYSQGLHQGVSGIEEGLTTLSPETSIKGLASVDWYFKDKLFVQAVGYYQNIKDYIYLQPQAEFRLTIRGAFPVFRYQQTDARLYGTDWQVTYEPMANLKWINRFALVRGNEVASGLALINLPSDNWQSTLQYNFNPTKPLRKRFIALSSEYVWQQNRIAINQDFVAPPAAYLLLNFSAGATFQVNESKFNCSIGVDNLLNTEYRDYLNRLRYFADETGRNIKVRVSWAFEG